VSKHLGVLKQAGLVHDRRDGRQTHYSARPASLKTPGRLDDPSTVPLRDRFDRLETIWTGWTNDRARRRRAFRSSSKRVMPHPPEKIWRALTQTALLRTG